MHDEHGPLQAPGRAAREPRAGRRLITLSRRIDATYLYRSEAALRFLQPARWSCVSIHCSLAPVYVPVRMYIWLVYCLAVLQLVVSQYVSRRHQCSFGARVHVCVGLYRYWCLPGPRRLRTQSMVNSKREHLSCCS
jgi:hypothetical protein